MGFFDYFKGAGRGKAAPAQVLPGEPPPISSERGSRSTPEDAMKQMYRSMWVDPAHRAVVRDIRDMDRRDGRVKMIHKKITRDCVSGGLLLSQGTPSEVITREWDAFSRRLQLNRAEKLKSDARGMVMEGCLPLQIVLDDGLNVVNAIRMPSETILPVVTPQGNFADVREAFRQMDVMTGAVLARFPLWQLFMSRFDPDNFDDWGCYGRPFLDAARTTWQKLVMTEEDLVIRRRMRAPLKLAHVLEGASPDDLEKYRNAVEKEQGQITTDYYLNKKGGVTAVQGDANLDHIADVVHLLETFFAGSPLPMALAGYARDTARDVLEDLKRDYYEEVDLLQCTVAFGYQHAFKLHLLLRGIDADDSAYGISFAKPMTETPSQIADRGLKMRALNYPYSMVWQAMGDDPYYVRKRIEEERANFNPYPDGVQGVNPDGTPKISVTPSNARKGESGTSISNDGGAA